MNAAPESTTSRRVELNATLPGAVAQVAGRPVHTFWFLLSPHVREVVLAPERHFGESKVAWAWEEPEGPAPRADELIELRRRLGQQTETLLEATNDLSAHHGNDRAATLKAVANAFQQWSRHYLALPDERAVEFVARTTQGLMLHSWGAWQPGTVAGAAARDGAQEPLFAPPPRSHKRRFSLLAAGLFIVGVGVVAVMWRKPAEPPADAPADSASRAKTPPAKPLAPTLPPNSRGSAPVLTEHSSSLLTGSTAYSASRSSLAGTPEIADTFFGRQGVAATASSGGFRASPGSGATGSIGASARPDRSGGGSSPGGAAGGTASSLRAGHQPTAASGRSGGSDATSSSAVNGVEGTDGQPIFLSAPVDPFEIPEPVFAPTPDQVDEVVGDGDPTHLDDGPTAAEEVRPVLPNQSIAADPSLPPRSASDQPEEEPEPPVTVADAGTIALSRESAHGASGAFHVRFSHWRAELVRDEIMATGPQPVDGPTPVHELREMAWQAKLAAQPRFVHAPEVWAGLRSTVEPGAQPGLPRPIPAPLRADGLRWQALTSSEAANGPASLQDPLFLAIRLERSSAYSAQWEPDGSAIPSGWREDWLVLELPSTERSVANRRLRVLDHASGWSLVADVDVVAQSTGLPPPTRIGR